MNTRNENLSRWGGLLVEGPDAAVFLQAQLSNDVLSLNEQSVCLACYCTAKGRVLGSFFVIRKKNQFILICRQEIVAALIKRFSMFILRSQCKIRDASGCTRLSYQKQSTTELPMSVDWQGELACATLRKTTTGRMPMLTIDMNASSPESNVSKGLDDEFEQDLWDMGIAYITGPTVERFVPQSVNFDLVGAIGFNKGCYPGQEIVARTHYLGKNKKRTFKAQAITSLPIPEGTDVWLRGKQYEPVGVVVNQVQAENTLLLLFETNIDLLENNESIFLIDCDGQHIVLIEQQAPPYDIHGKGNQF